MSRRKFVKTASLLLIPVWVFSFFSVFCVNSILAETNYDEQIEQKEEERGQMESELEKSEWLEYSYLQEGLSLNEKMAALEGDLSELSAGIAEDEAELGDIEKDLDQKAKEIEEKDQKISEISQSLYKKSRVSIIEIIFSSEGIDDLLQQIGIRKFGIGHLMKEVRALQEEKDAFSSDFNELSDHQADLQSELDTLNKEKTALENQKKAYELMAAAEAAKQRQIIGQIANITAEQEALIAEKMKATEQDTSVGEYEDVVIELPDPPFSPAFAVPSIGFPHRLGLNQYGAYGRSKAGQSYTNILSAYYNAELSSSYPVTDEIYVEGYGWMSFEGQYMKGIAEMPTSWADSGGFEALKSQAVAARSYALAVTNNGEIPICATQACQVYNHSKASDPAAARWHQAVAETEGQVLVHGGNPIHAYYASTAGGYTRLPTDFDVGWLSNPPYLKRVVDYAQDGKAYDGPGHGNSPWYYKVWYAQSDVHPWLTEAEMVDLFNSALLPEEYNQYLSHPDNGGWSHAQVRAKLNELGIKPIDDISTITVLNHNTGYTQTVVVVGSSGTTNVNGIRFWQVYKLRSRGYLALWSSLYDIIVK